jgi:hypothetical protein
LQAQSCIHHTHVGAAIPVVAISSSYELPRKGANRTGVPSLFIPWPADPSDKLTANEARVFSWREPVVNDPTLILSHAL